MPPFGVSYFPLTIECHYWVLAGATICALLLLPPPGNSVQYIGHRSKVLCVAPPPNRPSAAEKCSEMMPCWCSTAKQLINVEKMIFCWRWAAKIWSNVQATSSFLVAGHKMAFFLFLVTYSFSSQFVTKLVMLWQRKLDRSVCASLEEGSPAIAFIDSNCDQPTLPHKSVQTSLAFSASTSINIGNQTTNMPNKPPKAQKCWFATLLGQTLYKFHWLYPLHTKK